MGRVWKYAWVGAALVAFLTLTATACNSNSSSTSTGGASTSATTSEATSTGSPLPTASPIPPGPVTVDVAKTKDGQVLVDGNGMTFYVYLPDNLGDPQCVDACTNTWLPVYVTGTPKAGAGVGKDVIGTMKRDGNEQLTLGGQPAYLFAGDTAAGDTNGQGVDNLWYMVAPDGSRVVGVG